MSSARRDLVLWRLTQALWVLWGVAVITWILRLGSWGVTGVWLAAAAILPAAALACVVSWLQGRIGAPLGGVR